jgi:hypothetical protein
MRDINFPSEGQGENDQPDNQQFYEIIAGFDDELPNALTGTYGETAVLGQDFPVGDYMPPLGRSSVPPEFPRDYSPEVAAESAVIAHSEVAASSDIAAAAGGGDVPTPPSDNSAELTSPGDDAERVREACIREVHEAVADLQQRIAAGETNIDGEKISHVMADMVKQAAQQGDIARVDSLIDTTFKMPGAYAKATACLEGIAAGSMHAHEMLTAALKTEQIDISLATVIEKDADPSRMTMHYTPMFNGVLRVCQENDIPPNAWIETYSATPEHKWDAYTRHHLNVIDDLDPTSDAHQAHQAQLEQKWQELAEGSYDPDFVFRRAEDALRRVKDPEVGRKLAETFTGSIVGRPLTMGSFRKVLQTGISLLGNADIVADSQAVTFDEIVQATASELADRTGTNPGLIALEKLPWNFKLDKYKGATPAEMAEGLRAQVSDLLSDDTPDDFNSASKSAPQLNYEAMEAHMDFILSSEIKDRLTGGDFAAVSEFMPYISSKGYRETTYREALREAHTTAQVDQLRPSRIALEPDPANGSAIAHEFRVARARVTGDVSALKQMTTEALREIAAKNESGKRAQVHGYDVQETMKDAYRAVNAIDPEQGTQFAKKTLAKLRDLGGSHSAADFFTRELLFKHDPEELVRTYNQNTSYPPGHWTEEDRLDFLWTTSWRLGQR